MSNRVEEADTETITIGDQAPDKAHTSQRKTKGRHD